MKTSIVILCVAIISNMHINKASQAVNANNKAGVTGEYRMNPLESVPLQTDQVNKQKCLLFWNKNKTLFCGRMDTFVDWLKDVNNYDTCMKDFAIPIQSFP